MEIPLVIQQIVPEHFLCSLGPGSIQANKRQSFCPHGVDTLAGQRDSKQ